MRLLHARHHHDLRSLSEENPDPTEAEIREVLSGNLCRCTGYQNIVAADRQSRGRQRRRARMNDMSRNLA